MYITSVHHTPLPVTIDHTLVRQDSSPAYSVKSKLQLNTSDPSRSHISMSKGHSEPTDGPIEPRQECRLGYEEVKHVSEKVKSLVPVLKPQQKGKQSVV